MDDPAAQTNRATEPPRGMSVAARVGLEQMRQRLGIGAPRRPRIGRDDRFELISCLGRGGMGEVYLARDTVLEREVALKVVAAKFRHSPHLRLRLLREARSLAKLAHPNVLEVYDVDTAESGELVVAVAYVKGSTLERWQAGRPLRAALAVYLDAGRGLAAAHAAGIIHRDFKPANVLIADASGRVVVGDFGLAAEIRSAVHDGEPVTSDLSDALSTSPGALLGTPAFMAPELLAGQSASIASDQYAFGVSLWEAATGSLPFRTLERTPMPVRPRDMPRWLYQILRRTLASEPSERFPDMANVLAAIERGLARRRVGLASAGLLGLAGLLVWSWWPMPVEPEPEPVVDLCEETLLPNWPDRRQQIESLLGGDYATQMLDESANRLRVRAAEHCSAQQRDPVEQHCLEAWRDELDRRGEMFERFPDLELLELRDHEECLEAPPVLEPQVREHLDAAERHRLQREFEAALADAEAALELASTEGIHCEEPFDATNERAAAYFELAQIHTDRGLVPTARAAIRAAFDDAVICGQSELQLRARIVDAKLLALDLEQPEAADAMLRGVMTLELLRSPEASWHREQLAITRGFIAYASGEPEQAIEHYHEALDMLGEGPDTLLERAKLHIDIGATYESVGRYDEALASYEAAARIVARELDESHPETRNYRAIVALSRVLISNNHAAADELEQLVPTLDDPAIRGKARLVLSRYFTDLDGERALAHASALALELEQLGTIAPRARAEMLTEAGQMLREIDPWRSTWMLEQALAIWSSLGEQDNFDLGELCYAQTLLELGQERAAWVHARAVNERGPSDAIVRELAQEVIDEAALRGGFAAQPR